MMLTENDSKTIRMPQSVWDKWEAALSDPESKQGVGALCDGNGGYCCLGLLQMAVDGKVELLTEEDRDELKCEFGPESLPDVGSPALSPSIAWLTQHGVTFRSKYRDNVRIPEVRHKGGYDMVSELNDGGKSFVEILELMRPHVETY